MDSMAIQIMQCGHYFHSNHAAAKSHDDRTAEQHQLNCSSRDLQSKNYTPGKLCTPFIQLTDAQGSKIITYYNKSKVDLSWKMVHAHVGIANCSRQETSQYRFNLVSNHLCLFEHTHVSQNSAIPSKNAVFMVFANIKHSRQFRLTSKFWSIHYCGKRLYVHMFDMVDTAFSYGRALVGCKFLQESSKVKGSCLHEI